MDDGADLGHPLRAALMELLRAQPTLTSTEAARRLGESSGACSFHLRQLARAGHIEDAGPARGRARPWRLRTGPPPEPDPGFGRLARQLEDEGYQRWLALRPTAPHPWRRDEAFSEVVHLTPDELHQVADAVRALLAPLRERPAPPGAAPVGVVARLFPLLPEPATDPAPRAARPHDTGAPDGDT
ncbi:ArsR/SmtB family transcription factor [Allonocardiopsis opalescens]|uniref:DNA-binding transcriptional ArsR family regulator n=1 Tax=Allonocardiopsis opalescens TaxID=1144618 RepID=A0A2T0PU87_9ACTN|nr:helix-turn-helix domain-containing protein [Allonocardiopsis opalescens]PRX92296.1 DNA-binding transcriptional ArsR family regulator [Allonocardiopsis opalescens]